MWKFVASPKPLSRGIESQIADIAIFYIIYLSCRSNSYWRPYNVIQNFLNTVQDAKSEKISQTKTAQWPTRLKRPRSSRKVNLLSPSTSNDENKATKAFNTNNRYYMVAMVTVAEVETVDVFWATSAKASQTGLSPQTKAFLGNVRH